MISFELGQGVSYSGVTRTGVALGIRLDPHTKEVTVLVERNDGVREFVPVHHIIVDGNAQSQNPNMESAPPQEPKPYYHARDKQTRSNAREAAQLFAAFLTTQPLMIVGEHATVGGVIDALGEWMRQVGLDEVGEDA